MTSIRLPSAAAPKLVLAKVLMYDKDQKVGEYEEFSISQQLYLSFRISLGSYYHPLETFYTPDISGGKERVEAVKHSWWTQWARYTKQLLS
ncbi:hypothetical protein ZWY2020_006978 [Hordeum vulgare]|nr:hypothetical protein ZWY2020_006978 [Hordeum vulgare]